MCCSLALSPIKLGNSPASEVVVKLKSIHAFKATKNSACHGDHVCMLAFIITQFFVIMPPPSQGP